jgi:hypothetical protein
LTRTSAATRVQVVVFSAPKDGYLPTEWEDGAAAGSFGGSGGGEPSTVRFVVADGATETYESRLWVCQLIASFMSPDQARGASWPELERASMTAWFTSMQEQWPVVAPAPRDFIEQEKMAQGTLATFVGGQILGLDTPKPVWQAAALGDAVLFHVRDGRLVGHFPPLRSADFDSAPEGISTLTKRLTRMREQLLFQRGRLAPGDTIFAATDAFAKWMITREEKGDGELWPLLGDLAHPSVFTQLVTAQRRAMAMKDDDVTLMRIRLLAQPPNTVVVCL